MNLSNGHSEKFLGWLKEKIKHYKRHVGSLFEEENVVEPLDSGVASQLPPHAPANTISRLREELLGLDPSGETELRSRKDEAAGGVGVDDLQSQQLSDEQKKEKVIEAMMTMIREWKEQSKIVNRIIRKDIDAIDKSTNLADSHQSRLKEEANSLP